MGKKHKHPEHENLERWLVSYADFITLLFATFVVLYALSQADLAKFKTVSKAIRDAFNPAKSIMTNPGGIMQGSPQSSVLQSSGNSVVDKVMPKFPENAQREGTPVPNEKQPAAPTTASVQASVKEVNKILEGLAKNAPKSKDKEKEKPDKPAELKLQNRGLVISLPTNIAFDPGSAVLKSTAYPVLDKLAPQLKNAMVQVEGHTDNQPISSKEFPSNWELSAARASSVVRYLVAKHHIVPKQISAAGYADTRPIASNGTVEGRKKNRHVDIIILSATAADTDPAVAHINEKNINVDPPKVKPDAKPVVSGVKTNTVFSDSQPSRVVPMAPINIKPEKPSILEESKPKEKH